MRVNQELFMGSTSLLVLCRVAAIFRTRGAPESLLMSRAICAPPHRLRIGREWLHGRKK